MGQIINIGTKINLDILLRSKLYIQADSGGGKSYAMRKTVESVGSKVQQIILDAEGDFVTLREEFNFALVSKDGDIPLSVEYAETLALKILETNISVIIDLYELKAHQRLLFVQRFLNALMNAPKTLWHDCLVYIDEADMFCPQGDEKTDHARAVIDFCTRGRKRGYAAVLATQRISLVSKSALAQCRNKLIGLCTLDIDQKRAGAELGFTDKRKILGLRNLEVGEFYVFGPAISKEVKKIKIAKVITSHPEPGKRIVKAPPTPDAIKKILSKLKDIPEEAEKELRTKRDLMEKINLLERQLRDYKKAPLKPGKEVAIDAITPLKQEIQILRATIKEKDGQLTQVQKQYAILANKFQQLKNKASDILQKGIHEISAAALPEVKQFADIPIPPISKLVNTEVVPAGKKAVMPTQKPEQKIIIDADDHYAKGSLDKGPHTLLRVIASLHPQPVSRERLSVLSGYSLRSSTFSVHVSTLNTRGLIEKTSDGFKITDEGLHQVGEFEPVSTDSEAVIKFWTGKLDAGPAKMLQILCDHWPNAITREELSQQSGYSMSSSTFSVHVSTLNTLKLITKEKGMLKASNTLFENV